MNSTSSLDSNITSSDESKHYNMKQFISNVRQYIQTKTEESAIVINRYLQLLSVTIDMSVFDPTTSMASEFFISLYDLLSCIEQRSTLVWCCVNVLCTACQNPAARYALIHTYQFLPSLSRLLCDQLTTEKKIKLLSLMQEITCGIKISWQIPHLQHLMSVLTKWLATENEEIVTLSLGVLVNLCYRNLPAIYTLSRCVDIKKFVRICTTLKGLKIEIHVCKLIIILDSMNGKIPDEAFIKLVIVTFKSLCEAFRSRDSILLRHIVEFFLDMWKQNNMNNTFIAVSEHGKDIEQLLQDMETTVHRGGGDVTDYDSECMALLFQFFNFLIELHLPEIKNLYSRLINMSLKWIKTDLVCSEAIGVLRSIALDLNEDQTKFLEPLLSNLPTFLLTIESNEHFLAHSESNKRLSALMELLRVLAKADGTRAKVLEVLQEDLIGKLFVPLLGSKIQNSSAVPGDINRTDIYNVRVSNKNLYSSEAILLHVNAIGLIDVLAKHDQKWIGLYMSLIQQKQIHMTLAQALLRAPKETRALILNMSHTSLFPINEVTEVMCDIQPLMDIGIQSNSSTQNLSENLCFPIMSVTQMEQLDQVLDKFKRASEQSNMSNITLSDVMELYEYKLATMSHAERAAIASIEAASQRCTHLQHRTAQLTSEVSKLHQLLLHTQQQYDDNIKITENLKDTNNQLQEWNESEKTRHALQKSNFEKQSREQLQALEDVTRKYKETESARKNLEEKADKLKNIMNNLETNVVKKEKLLEKKDDQISKLNTNLEHSKMRNKELEQYVKQVESDLASKNTELTERTRSVQNLKQILGTITELTSSQYVEK